MEENIVKNRTIITTWLKYVFIFFVLPAIIAITYVSYGHKSYIYKQLDNFHLIPRQEHFTELYFNNHTNLPKNPTINGMIKFSFAIHNLEGKDKEYLYVVYFKKGKYRTTTVDQKTVLVKDNEEKIITETYKFNSNTIIETIFVGLTDLNQEIHFSLSR